MNVRRACWRGLGVGLVSCALLGLQVVRVWGESGGRAFLPLVARPLRPPVVAVTWPNLAQPLPSYVIEISGSVTSPYPLTAGPAVAVLAAGQEFSFLLQTDGAGAFRQRVPLFAGQNRVAVWATSAQGETRVERAVDCSRLAPDLRIILMWDTGADLDLHLVRPGGSYEAPNDDCFWWSPNPDWGVPGDPNDDPELNIEDRDGYGPECIVLPRAAAGEYSLYIHHQNAGGSAPPAHFALHIWYMGAGAVVGPYDVLEDQVAWMTLILDPPGGRPGLRWQGLAPAGALAGGAMR